MTPDGTQKPPFLGFGLGLRPQHYPAILDPLMVDNSPVDWFEVLSENYMIGGGQPLRKLDQIAERFPVVLHGVSLSIASTAPLNMDYLAALKALAERINPQWVSDHLCWTGVHGFNLHDLLPVPYTEEALDHVVDRVKRVQDFLGRRIAIENISTYVSYEHSTIPEWEFVKAMAERADCWLVLDVNNVYVNSFNHGFDPAAFLEGVPADRVIQFHVSGHSHMETHIVDTHDAEVCPEVWDLYALALKRFGAVSTMIERDDNIPTFEELSEELGIARRIAADILPGLQARAAE